MAANKTKTKVNDINRKGKGKGNVKTNKTRVYRNSYQPEEIIREPVIYITERAKRMLDAYVRQCGMEISGLGKVSQLEGNGFLIEELYLFTQTVTQASTDLSQEAISNFLYEMDDRGLDLNTIRCWWHSHVNMDVFWSPTDKNTIKGLSAGDYLISIVANKRGGYLVRLDIYRPVRWKWDDLELRVIFEPDGSMDETVAKEIAEKIDVKPVYTYYQQHPSYGQYPGVTQTFPEANQAAAWGLPPDCMPDCEVGDEND